MSAITEPPRAKPIPPRSRTDDLIVSVAAMESRERDNIRSVAVLDGRATLLERRLTLGMAEMTRQLTDTRAQLQEHDAMGAKLFAALACIGVLLLAAWQVPAVRAWFGL